MSKITKTKLERAIFVVKPKLNKFGVVQKSIIDGKPLKVVRIIGYKEAKERIPFKIGDKIIFISDGQIINKVKYNERKQRKQRKQKQ